MRMYKQIEVEETMIVATGNDVSKSLGKHFNYEMSDRKAKSNKMLEEEMTNSKLFTTLMDKFETVSVRIGMLYYPFKRAI